jgi:hypothetical protein
MLRDVAIAVLSPIFRKHEQCSVLLAETALLLIAISALSEKVASGYQLLATS